ncbi:hypothetical protein F5883DRAFT_511743 [Diaporthe sp. PMI_573]|nr:hypothetical protein F5883DRAFT_511743 [Diaporthaceae sp. PMI_573]
MDSSCAAVGDGDLYGLGVRLGLYFQWCAGFLLRNLDGSWKSISTVRTANNTLSYALNLAVVINTVKGTALSVDYLIVYYLTIALFYSESYNLLVKKNGGKGGFRYTLRADVPLILQNALFAFATLFGAWFWIRGVFETHQLTCVAKAALFGLFELESSQWRQFAVTFAILLGLTFVLFLVVHLIEWVSETSDNPVSKVGVAVASNLRVLSAQPIWNLKRQLAKLPRQLLRPNPRFDEIHWSIIPSLLHWFIINLMGPLLAIVSVERMLQANHLMTPPIPASTGQMIALLIGISSLCMALWDIGKGRWGASQHDGTDLLIQHAYNSRRPLRKDQMERMLANLKVSIETYDFRDVQSRGRGQGATR